MDHIFRRLSLKDIFRLSPVSAVLVLVNIIVFVFGLIMEYYGGWDQLIFEGGINSVYVLEYGEYWRLFSAGFIHSDVIHILFNVGFGLYVISAGLERIIGSVRFAVIYFVGLIGSSFVVLYFTDDVIGTFMNQTLIFTAGASGAIFAVIGALLYITFVRPDMISRNEASSIRQLVLINMIFTFAVSGISITGHLGGLVIGLLISYLLIPQQRREIKDENIYDYTNDDEEDNNWWEN